MLGLYLKENNSFLANVDCLAEAEEFVDMCDDFLPLELAEKIVSTEDLLIVKTEGYEN